MTRPFRTALAAAWLAVLITAGPARAIYVFGNYGDPDPSDPTGATRLGRYTTAPTGAIADSGYQYESSFSGQGTPIAPHYILTAAHLGTQVGRTFQVYQNGVNETFTVTNVYDDNGPGGSDLRVLQVDKAFTSYAPIYTGQDEVGRDLVVYGRGTSRGAAVNGPFGQQGYLWAPGAGPLSYGQNIVNSTASDPGTNSRNDYLTFAFSPVPNGSATTTATLSGGDSGGGLFIRDPRDGLWKLAGVNYGVEGGYLDANRKPLPEAGLFDQRGFYVPDNVPGGYTYIDPMTHPDPVSQLAYSTRVSDKLDFLGQFVNTVSVPEPFAATMMATGLGIVAACRRLSRRR